MIFQLQFDEINNVQSVTYSNCEKLVLCPLVNLLGCSSCGAEIVVPFGYNFELFLKK